MQTDNFQPDYSDPTTEDVGPFVAEDLYLDQSNEAQSEEKEVPLELAPRQRGKSDRRRESLSKKPYSRKHQPRRITRVHHLVQEYLCDTTRCFSTNSQCAKIHMHLNDLWKCLMEVDTHGYSSWLETELSHAHKRRYLSAPLYAKLKHLIHSHFVCFQEYH